MLVMKIVLVMELNLEGWPFGPAGDASPAQRAINMPARGNAPGKKINVMFKP
jgi:hypothetical protein